MRTTVIRASATNKGTTLIEMKLKLKLKQKLKLKRGGVALIC